MIKENFISLEVKKYLNKKGLTINKKNNSKNHSSELNDWRIILRVVLGSLVIISFFSILPTINDFKNERAVLSQEFKNNSKSNFKKTIEETNSIEVSLLDEELNTKNLFEDVFQFDNLPVDTVRLSASTIDQLFKDTNYNLKDVRKQK